MVRHDMMCVDGHRSHEQRGFWDKGNGAGPGEGDWTIGQCLDRYRKGNCLERLHPMVGGIQLAQSQQPQL